MAATRTPGITVDFRGDLIIDKEYRGIRLLCRVGKVSQEEAETVLRTEMLRPGPATSAHGGATVPHD